MFVQQAVAQEDILSKQALESIELTQGYQYGWIISDFMFAFNTYVLLTLAI